MTNLDFKKLVNKYAIILIDILWINFSAWIIIARNVFRNFGRTGRNESNHEKYSFDFSVLHQHRDFFDNN